MAAFSRLFTRVLPYERSLTKGTSRTEGAPAETTDGMMRRENKVYERSREEGSKRRGEWLVNCACGGNRRHRG
jgi:hypothetical protein